MTDSQSAMFAGALPDYDVGSLIGRGQFGVVYAARHRQLGRRVAVKVLENSAASGGTDAARFRREARILASLDHPHVVAVYDYRESANVRLLVMELLGGGTLADRAAEGLSQQTAVAVTVAAASGLHHAHRAGVLHRDVKPQNLMFDDRGVLKVTDFGLARHELQETRVELSVAQAFMGTPAYMSPEQARRALGGEDDDVGAATDQYSLAAVLYEMLTGQLTHAVDGGGLALCSRRANEPARAMLGIDPTLPAPVTEVAMRALERDPRDRFDTIEQFAAELDCAARAVWGPSWIETTDTELRDPQFVRPANTQPVDPQSGARDSADRPPRKLRRVAGAAGAAVLVAGLAVVSSLDSGDEREARRTAVAGDANITMTVEEIWSAPTGGNVFATPLLVDDLAVVGSEDGSVYAFDVESGEPRWVHSTAGPVDSSAGLVTSPQGLRSVVVGSRDGAVRAIEVASGAEIWSTPLGFEVVSSPAVTGDKIVVGADGIVALDSQTGERRWTVDTDAEIVASPAIEDNTAVVGSNGGTLYAVAVDDGAIHWRRDLGHPLRSSPAVMDGQIVVGDLDGSLRSFTLSDGQELWHADLGAAVKSSPLVTAELVVVGTDAGDLVALDRFDGSERWRWVGTKPVDSSPALGEGWVAVGSNDRAIHFIDLDGGDEVGRFVTGGPVLSSPQVAGNIVVVGSHDDKVYAVRAG